jgi:surface antigen
MKTRIPRIAVAALLCAGALTALPEPVWADPPPWAPAHGWRKKHDKNYVGYTGTEWGRDYGILGGRCDRQAVGAAVGAVVGGAIGSHVGDGKPVATVLGAVIGSVIGVKVAAEIDNGDRGCIGHALELGAPNARINWVNPTTRVSYVLTPMGGYKQEGRVCREFTLQASNAKAKDSGRAFACQMRDGTWQLTQKEGGGKADKRNDGDDRPGKGKGKGKNRA